FNRKFTTAESTSPKCNGPKTNALSSCLTSPGDSAAMSGSMIPLIRPSTTAPNAAPMMTAVASSTTLPRIRKSRNPFSMLSSQGCWRAHRSDTTERTGNFTIISRKGPAVRWTIRGATFEIVNGRYGCPGAPGVASSDRPTDQDRQRTQTGVACCCEADGSCCGLDTVGGVPTACELEPDPHLTAGDES